MEIRKHEVCVDLLQIFSMLSFIDLGLILLVSNNKAMIAVELLSQMLYLSRKYPQYT